MTPVPRTRTPRQHIYILTVPNVMSEPLLEVLIEANSIREARAWFTQNLMEIREATPREVFNAGQSNRPFFTAEESTQDEETPPTASAPGDEDPELWPLSDPELSAAFEELEK